MRSLASLVGLTTTKHAKDIPRVKMDNGGDAAIGRGMGVPDNLWRAMGVPDNLAQYRHNPDATKDRPHSDRPRISTARRDRALSNDAWKTDLRQYLFCDIGGGYSKDRHRVHFDR